MPFEGGLIVGTRPMLDSAAIRQILQSIAHEQIRYAPTYAVLQHWLASLASGTGGEIPGFDPMEAPRLLPYLYLLEKQGNRLKYRVSGEEVNRLFGSNHAGRYLDEVVPAPVYAEVSPFFLDVFLLKACIFKGHVVLPDKEYMEFERVLLPTVRRGALHMLGTLALSIGSPMRDVEPIPDPVGPGFHFTQVDLRTGTVEHSRKSIAPLVEPSTARDSNTSF